MSVVHPALYDELVLVQFALGPLENQLLDGLHTYESNRQDFFLLSYPVRSAYTRSGKTREANLESLPPPRFRAQRPLRSEQRKILGGGVYLGRRASLSLCLSLLASACAPGEEEREKVLLLLPAWEKSTTWGTSLSLGSGYREKKSAGTERARERMERAVSVVSRGVTWPGPVRRFADSSRSRR